MLWLGALSAHAQQDEKLPCSMLQAIFGLDTVMKHFHPERFKELQVLNDSKKSFSNCNINVYRKPVVLIDSSVSYDTRLRIFAEVQVRKTRNSYLLVIYQRGISYGVKAEFTRSKNEFFLVKYVTFET